MNKMNSHKTLENAVLLGDINLIKELIDQGIDLNVRGDYKRTVLYDAIVKGFEDVVKLLCDHKAQVNIYDNAGKTPLHFAAIHNKLTIAKYLIIAGADVNAIDVNGNNPLFDAVFNSKGVPDIIILLKENGADYNIENNYGVSAKKLSETIGNFDVSYLFK
jgi:ankyrin repeat protein